MRARVGPHAMWRAHARRVTHPPLVAQQDATTCAHTHTHTTPTIRFDFCNHFTHLVMFELCAPPRQNVWCEYGQSCTQVFPEIAETRTQNPEPIWAGHQKQIVGTMRCDGVDRSDGSRKHRNTHGNLPAARGCCARSKKFGTTSTRTRCHTWHWCLTACLLSFITSNCRMCVCVCV